MGDCQSAVSTIKPVVEARWSYPPLWVLLGECLIETGDLEVARLSLEKALTVGPMMSGVYAMLEPLYLVTGDQVKAREIHRKWIERANALPSDPATEVAHYFRQVATACLNAQQLDCAVELMQQAIEYDPVRPESHDLLARALFARGDLNAARAAGDASLDLNPSWAAAHLTLGRIADEEGRMQQAVDHYRNYIALAPPDTDTREVERRISSLINQIDDHG